MKKFILLLFAFVISMFSFNQAFAEAFDIKNYNVNIDITEDKLVNIEEDIDVYFTRPSHGIIREIPAVSNIVAPGGQTYSQNVKIKLLGVNEHYVVTSKYPSFKIKIGNAHVNVNGNVKYIIKYQMKLPNDIYDDKDEFYFNVIGTQWQTPINKVNFTINLPKDTDSEIYGMSIGRYGTLGYNENDGNLIKEGRTFKGYTSRVLKNNEGITFRIELPEGYFNQFKINTDTSNIDRNLIITISVIFILLLTLIAFGIWFIFGKDEPVIPVVNFYPPNNLNSAEIGTIYDNKADTKDVVSLIVYLSSKGYIDIQDEGISFTLTKKKEYTEKNLVEAMMMKALFRKGNVITKEELEVSRTFYKDCKTIKQRLMQKVNLSLFDKNACSPAKMAIMIVCIIGLIISLLFVMDSFSFNFINKMIAVPDTAMLLLFPFMAIVAYLFYTLSPESSSYNKSFITTWAILFGGSPMVFFAQMNIFEFSGTNIYVLLLNIVCIVVSAICLKNLPKYNEFGRRQLGEIKGLRNFLEVAEKHRIEQLVAENPSYCYDILPFAYVLGLSDKWINNFAGIVNEPPNWYRGNSFDVHSFHSMTTSMSQVSIPSRANGGISRSSGGGCSGGGHGGGGGHSW